MWFEDLFSKIKNIIIPDPLMKFLWKLPGCNDRHGVSNCINKDRRDIRGTNVQEIFPEKVVMFFRVSYPHKIKCPQNHCIYIG